MPSTTISPNAGLDSLGEHLGRQLHGLGYVPPRRSGIAGGGRRGIAVPLDPNTGLLSVTRQRGVLRWSHTVGGGPQRSGARASLLAGEVVTQFEFQKIQPSKVGAVLLDLDRKLTPKAWRDSAGLELHGFRQLKGGALVPFPDPSVAAGKRVFLFIHGTFSNGDMYPNELAEAPGGPELMADLERKYDLVLAFDHPTVSTSPVMNAFDLAARLRPAPKSVDIVAHSRGGLVTRWYCEGFAPAEQRRRALLVASPIGGTSLASPARLRQAMDHLLNVADWLRGAGLAGAANPLFLATGVLSTVLGTLGHIAADGPIFDAAVAMIPGLAAQSRVGNNTEILRLRANTGGFNFTDPASPVQYSVVRANFEPKDPGWNFLQYFSKPMQRIADAGADLVFADDNDLVVDTDSMTEAADGRKLTLAHDFGTSTSVFHTNYFRQPETVEAIRKTFGI